MRIKEYLKRAGLYIGAALLFVGSNILMLTFYAAVNAVGAWIILNQFDYSLSFWQYIAVGAGLLLITGTNKSGNS